MQDSHEICEIEETSLFQLNILIFLFFKHNQNDFKIFCEKMYRMYNLISMEEMKKVDKDSTSSGRFHSNLTHFSSPSGVRMRQTVSHVHCTIATKYSSCIHIKQVDAYSRSYISHCKFH